MIPKEYVHAIFFLLVSELLNFEDHIKGFHNKTLDPIYLNATKNMTMSFHFSAEYFCKLQQKKFPANNNPPFSFLLSFTFIYYEYKSKFKTSKYQIAPSFLLFLISDSVQGRSTNFEISGNYPGEQYLFPAISTSFSLQNNSDKCIARYTSVSLLVCNLSICSNIKRTDC